MRDSGTRPSQHQQLSSSKASAEWSDSSPFDAGKALLSSDADKLQSRPLPVEVMRRRHVLALNLVMTAARAPGLSTSLGILPALHVFVQSLLLGISSFKLAQLSLLCSAGSSTCSHSSSCAWSISKASHILYKTHSGVTREQKTLWLLVT